MAEYEFDVFLAHNSDDKPQIRAVSHSLKRRGLRPWLDEEQILAGQSWQKVVQTAIPCVRAATVLLGQAGIGNWQEEEAQLILDTCKEANKPVFLTLLPGVQKIPPELGFLKQKHIVSFNDGVQKALHGIESGIRGAPAKPFYDAMLCFDDDTVEEVNAIAGRLGDVQLSLWREGLNATALQFAVMRNLEKEFERISSLAVFVGAKSRPWEQEIVADIILEFRDQHRPVIPVMLKTADAKVKLPVYLRRLGYVDFHDEMQSALDRLILGIRGEESAALIME